MQEELAKKYAFAFNQVREEFAGVELSFNEMEEALKRTDCVPYNKAYIRAMRDAGVLLQSGKKLLFTDTPVHFNTLAKVIEKFRKAHNAYQKAWYKNKTTKPTVEEAIAILKEAGYKIYKPSTTYEEI
jgi:hypothetical protein